MSPTDDELATCLRVLVELGAIAQTNPGDERVVAVRQASAGLVKAARAAKRASNRAESRRIDTQLAATTFVFRQPTDEATLTAQVTPASIGTYARPKRCYICKNHFNELNSQYYLHCDGCAARDRLERDARVDMSERRVVITGGRIQIGFHLALKMLRDGAEVVVTTRFPVDARMRFEEVSDSSSWIDRLTIVGLDLCDLRGLTDFVVAIRDRWSWLDCVVFNAASTVRRHPDYYAREIALNAGSVALPSLDGRAGANELASTTRRAALQPNREFEPRQEDPAAELLSFDETGEALDRSPRNSWVLGLGEIDRREVLENYLVGGFAPFELLGELLPLLEASPHPDRHVVVVSAMEGQFAKREKTRNHPHTNMTKAAANMMVRTCADDLAKRRVYLNAVDTGWVNDENPHEKKQQIRERGFRPPLDVVDGAARIYHPIRVGRRGEPVWGKFLKDYASASW